MNLGQVYTKPAVADFMAGLFDLPANSRVLDPCFGTGVFVDALAATDKYQIDATEIDPESYSAYKSASGKRVNLFCRNFFDHTGKDYDGIIMNPPYVRQEQIDLMSPIGVTKALLRRSCRRFNIPPKSNLYIYFIVHAIELLRDGGELIIIFPNSWQNSTFGPFLNQVFSLSGHISKFINVEGNPFTDSPLVDVCILKFIKGRQGITANQTLKVSDYGISIAESAAERYSIESESTVPLSSVCAIKRGISTFYNKMFINPPVQDDSFLASILSSPKSVDGWTTERATLDKLLLVPGSTRLPEEISCYLELYKQQILRDEKPATLYKRILTSPYWYVLGTQAPSNLIFPYIVRHRPCFILNTASVIVRDNFYLLSHNLDDHLMFALLNNYFVYSQLEDKGKNYGNGILKIQKYDVDSLFIVNPSMIEPSVQKELIALAELLIASKDDRVLSEITQILSRFYPPTDIERIYRLQKAKRLKA